MKYRKPDMKLFYTLVIIIAILVVGAVAYPTVRDEFYLSNEEVERRIQEQSERLQEQDQQAPVTAEEMSEDKIQTVMSGLSVPWGIAFISKNELLVTERDGTLIHYKNGSSADIPVPNAAEYGEGGLLGIELHPQFMQNRLLYLYMTYQSHNSRLLNRVVRFRLTRDGLRLENPTVIIDGIPGANYHDGGRIRFGPDNHLYITTGDAGSDENAQSTSTLAGKILRVKDDGAIPETNPFDNAIYSYGHRNPQGLTWDMMGNLWSTEHGRSGVRSGYDEVNLIKAGSNYGWPEIQGPETRVGMVTPKAQSGPNTTWAPASALYYNGSIFFGGLRGQSLYEARLEGTTVMDVVRHFYNDFGRIRTVARGPDGSIYMTTSNTDGRGEPRDGDDKVIRINPDMFEANTF